MLKKSKMQKEEIKKYLKENFLILHQIMQTKIFLFKMKFLYPSLKLDIFYSPLKNLNTGLFGQSQLFTIGTDLYFYSPSPLQRKFRKVLGIYNIDKYTFMILQTSSGYYQIVKDNSTLFVIFLSFVDAKNYMELNYVRN